MTSMTSKEMLQYYVTGAIERGEAEPIIAIESVQSIGTINWKFESTWHYGHITEILHDDQSDIIFRYYTESMKREDGSLTMNPILKYSYDTNRVYFLTERSRNGNYPWPEFESKGYQANIVSFVLVTS